MRYFSFFRLFKAARRSKPQSRKAKPRKVNLVCELLEDRTVPSVTVGTDQPEYSPGQTAYFTAAGVNAGETVQFDVQNLDNGATHGPWQVTDQSAEDLDPVEGVVQTGWVVTEDSMGTTLVVSATALSTGETASATFTDALTIKLQTDTGTSNSDKYTNVKVFTIQGATTNKNYEVVNTSGGAVIGSALASGSSVDVTVSVADGSYTVFARQKDLPSNRTSNLTVTFDTTAPSTPDLDAGSDTGVSSTDNLTNDKTPSFTVTDPDLGNAAGDSQIQLVLGTPASTGGSVKATDSSTPWNLTSGSLNDGPNSLYARDRAGNFSTAIIVTIDTKVEQPDRPDLVAGSDTGTSDKDNYTKDATPTFTVSGVTDGDTIRVFADGSLAGSAIASGSTATVTVGTFVPGDSGLPSLGDATYSITALAMDNAGNVSDVSSDLDVTIDTVALAPAVTDVQDDSGFSNSDNVTRDNTPGINGTAEPGSTVALYSDGILVGTGITDNAGDWTIQPTLSDGDHVLTARVVSDKAGNLNSGFGASLTVVIDTISPSTPDDPTVDFDGTTIHVEGTVDLVQANPDLPAGGAALASKIRLFVDGSQVATLITTDGTYSFDYVAGPGTHTVQIEHEDRAGNSSFSASQTVSTIPPAPSAPDLTAASDTGTSDTDDYTADNTPTFTGTAQAGTTVSLYAGSTLVGTGLADGGGVWTITASTMPDGDQVMTATASNAGGTSPSSEALTITIDTLAPAVSAPDLLASSDSGASDSDNVTNSTAPSFSGTAEPGSVVMLYDGATLLGGTVAGGDGSWSFTIGLGEGTHSVHATATDIAGNTGTSASLTVVIDTTAPTITAVVPPPGPTGWYNIATGAPTISFEADDGGGSGIVSLTGPVTLGEGAGQSVTGTAVDLAGNSASTSVNDLNVDLTAPDITLTSPVNGGVYGLNQAVAADYEAADNLSGIDSITGTVADGANIDTASTGVKSFSVSATDVAGNEAQVTHTYEVKPWVQEGDTITASLYLNMSNVNDLGTRYDVIVEMVDADGNVFAAGTLASATPGLSSPETVSLTVLGNTYFDEGESFTFRISVQNYDTVGNKTAMVQLHYDAVQQSSTVTIDFGSGDQTYYLHSGSTMDTTNNTGDNSVDVITALVNSKTPYRVLGTWTGLVQV